MLKKTLILILLLCLTSCGYQAIHSEKNSINYDFSISELVFIGDRNINLKIKQKLNNYIGKNKNKKFILNISSNAERITVSKNELGNPTSFKSEISVKIGIVMQNDLKNSLKTNLEITEDFNYNNISNKFELKKYEREILINLAEIASDKLIFKLSNIQ